MSSSSPVKSQSSQEFRNLLPHAHRSMRKHSQRRRPGSSGLQAISTLPHLLPEQKLPEPPLSRMHYALAVTEQLEVRQQVGLAQKGRLRKRIRQSKGIEFSKTVRWGQGEMDFAEKKSRECRRRGLAWSLERAAEMWGFWGFSLRTSKPSPVPGFWESTVV